MKLLFLDFETNSNDPKIAFPTEVGVTYVESQGGVYTQLASRSAFFYDSANPPLSQEIIELTGITDEMLQKEGLPPAGILELLGFDIEEADFVLAHKAEYDRTVYEEACKRHGVEIKTPKDRWICTIDEVPWAKKYKCKKLSHLAFDHGIVSDVTKLHRANYDTELLADLITTKYSIDEIIAYAKTPWVYIFANGVTEPWKDGGVHNKQVKALGFGWERAPRTDAPVFPKRWVKRVKEFELAAEKEKSPFVLTRETPAVAPALSPTV